MVFFSETLQDPQPDAIIEETQKQQKVVKKWSAKEMLVVMRGKKAETNFLDIADQKPKWAQKPKDLKQQKQLKLTAINSRSKGVNLGSKPIERGDQNCAERLYIGVLEQGGHSTTETKRLDFKPHSPEEVVLEQEANLRSPKAAKCLDSGD